MVKILQIHIKLWKCRESELIYRLVQSASQLKWPWWFCWGRCVWVYMLQMEGRILISNYSTIRMKIKQPHFEWCEIIVELAWIL